MKYGSELQENVFAPWRLSYIAYDVLKMELKTRQLDHEWNDQDEADFIQVSFFFVTECGYH
jgi:SPX domain protein involved in polyphosphate accumulation